MKSTTIHLVFRERNLLAVSKIGYLAGRKRHGRRAMLVRRCGYMRRTDAIPWRMAKPENAVFDDDKKRQNDIRLDYPKWVQVY